MTARRDHLQHTKLAPQHTTLGRYDGQSGSAALLLGLLSLVPPMRARIFESGGRESGEEGVSVRRGVLDEVVPNRGAEAEVRFNAGRKHILLVLQRRDDLVCGVEDEGDGVCLPGCPAEDARRERRAIPAMEAPVGSRQERLGLFDIIEIFSGVQDRKVVDGNLAEIAGTECIDVVGQLGQLVGLRKFLKQVLQSQEKNGQAVVSGGTGREPRCPWIQVPPYMKVGLDLNP